MRRLIQKIFITKTDSAFIQMIRYGFISVIALCFDMGVFTLLILHYHTHVVVASSAGFLTGLVVSYIIAVQWAFSQRRFNRQTELAGTLLIGLIGIALTNGIIWLLAEPMHVDVFVAKAITVVVVFFWNFGARKVVLFSKPQPES